MAGVIRGLRLDTERVRLALAVREQRAQPPAAARTPAPNSVSVSASASEWDADSDPDSGANSDLDVGLDSERVQPRATIPPSDGAVIDPWADLEPDDGPRMGGAAAQGDGSDVDRGGLAAFDPRADAVAYREQLELERIAALEQAEAEGFAAGLARGAASCAREAATLGAMLASARTTLAAGIAGSEDVIVEIAFEALAKILGEAAPTRAGVLAVVRELLVKAGERERLLVRVAPVDHALLEQHRAQLLPGDDGRMIDLVADERVELGGCLVETTGGTLDGRLETQLQQLVEILTAARRGHVEGMP